MQQDGAPASAAADIARRFLETLPDAESRV